MSEADEFDYLPPPLDEVARAVGIAKALALWEREAGANIYIPKRAPEGHWLVECLGREAADALGAHFPRGTRLLIPLLEKSFYKRARMQAAQMLENGASRRDVVRATGVHERTIYRVKRRMKDSKQGQLF